VVGQKQGKQFHITFYPRWIPLLMTLPISYGEPESVHVVLSRKSLLDDHGLNSEVVML
jgi:hypothetical protein